MRHVLIRAMFVLGLVVVLFLIAKHFDPSIFQPAK
jgi:hypothetical protein